MLVSLSYGVGEFPITASDVVLANMERLEDKPSSPQGPDDWLCFAGKHMIGNTGGR